MVNNFVYVGCKNTAFYTRKSIFISKIKYYYWIIIGGDNVYKNNLTQINELGVLKRRKMEVWGDVEEKKRFLGEKKALF